MTADSTHGQASEPGDNETHERTEPATDIIGAFATGLRALADAANTSGRAAAVRIRIETPSGNPITDVLLDDGALRILTARHTVLTRQAARARAQQA